MKLVSWFFCGAACGCLGVTGAQTSWFNLHWCTQGSVFVHHIEPCKVLTFLEPIPQPEFPSRVSCPNARYGDFHLSKLRFEKNICCGMPWLRCWIGMFIRLSRTHLLTNAIKLCSKSVRKGQVFFPRCIAAVFLKGVSQTHPIFCLWTCFMKTFHENVPQQCKSLWQTWHRYKHVPQDCFRNGCPKTLLTEPVHPGVPDASVLLFPWTRFLRVLRLLV